MRNRDKIKLLPNTHTLYYPYWVYIDYTFIRRKLYRKKNRSKDILLCVDFSYANNYLQPYWRET